MRLAAYASVSSDEQAERGTIENQVDFGERYASLYQIGPIKWYKDDDVTGVASRSRLIKDAKAGLIELLLIYHLGRLGRSALIVINAIYELELGFFLLPLQALPILSGILFLSVCCKALIELQGQEMDGRYCSLWLINVPARIFPA